jgi:hypothetical protein
LTRARPVEEEIGQRIPTPLDQHRIMTIATLRPDGWPRAMTVGHASEGLTVTPAAIFISSPARGVYPAAS